MRYNPATDNAVANERAQASMSWVTRPQVEETMAEAIEVHPTPADEAIGSATLALWSSCWAFQRLQPGDMNRSDLVGLRRDVAAVVRELDRLSV